jgi:hypothetical protein
MKEKKRVFMSGAGVTRASVPVHARHRKPGPEVPFQESGELFRTTMQWSKWLFGATGRPEYEGTG